MPVSGLRHAVAIDFDPVNKLVYWSDDEKLEIKRSKMDGTGRAAVAFYKFYHGPRLK